MVPIDDLIGDSPGKIHFMGNHDVGHTLLAKFLDDIGNLSVRQIPSVFPSAREHCLKLNSIDVVVTKKIYNI
jgi:hypothetical protein